MEKQYETVESGPHNEAKVLQEDSARYDQLHNGSFSLHQEIQKIHFYFLMIVKYKFSYLYSFYK